LRQVIRNKNVFFDLSTWRIWYLEAKRTINCLALPLDFFFPTLWHELRWLLFSVIYTPKWIITSDSIRLAITNHHWHPIVL
jgi:hypothetical protein